jgi:hypothetical protein
LGNNRDELTVVEANRLQILDTAVLNLLPTSFRVNKSAAASPEGDQSANATTLYHISSRQICCKGGVDLSAWS